MIHNHPNLLASYLMQSRFIDSDGKLMDLSGNGHHGIITPGAGGFTTGPDGRVNSAYDFDGANTKIDCGNNTILQLTGNMTIAAWVNVNTSVSRSIVNKDGGTGDRGWYFAVISGGTIRIAVAINTTTIAYFTTTNSISNNTWTHLICVYNGSTLAVYVDGILQEGTQVNSVPATQRNSTVDVLIGSQLPSIFCDGPIASIQIYDAVFGQDWVSYQFQKLQQQLQRGHKLGIL